MENGNIYTSINAPIDRIIAGDKITVDIGCKNIEMTLDPSKESGSEYKIDNAGAKDGKYAFIKVFADFPKNKTSDEDREKLVKIWREVYGESKSLVKPRTV
jgi:hypothetical protein